MAVTINNDGQYLQAGAGDNAGATVISYGQTVTEGLQTVVLEETVNFADQTAAGYYSLTNTIPAIYITRVTAKYKCTGRSGRSRRSLPTSLRESRPPQ